MSKPASQSWRMVPIHSQRMGNSLTDLSSDGIMTTCLSSSMDRAPDFGSVGSGFDSWLGHQMQEIKMESTPIYGGAFHFLQAVGASQCNVLGIRSNRRRRVSKIIANLHQRHVILQHDRSRCMAQIMEGETVIQSSNGNLWSLNCNLDVNRVY